MPISGFGVVLFETLSGRRAFEGETTSDILASVLKFDPDWKVLPAPTPPSIVRLLHRCLTKDRKQRPRDIGEARIAIEQTLSGDVGPGLAPAASVQGPPQGTAVRGHALPWVIGAAMLASI